MSSSIADDRPTPDVLPEDDARRGRRKLVRDISGTMATQVAVLPLTLATGIVLSRGLEPDEKGVYTTATTFAAVAVTMGSLAVGKAMVYRLARGDLPSPSVRRTGLTLNVVNGALISAVMVVLAVTSRGTLFPDIPLGVLLAAVPIALLTQLRGNWESCLRGEQRNVEVNVSALVQSAAIVAGASVLAVFGALTPTSGVTARAAGIALACAYTVWRLGVRASGMPPGFDSGVAVDLVKWSVPLAVAGLGQSLSYRFDVLLVQRIEGTTEVGYYSITGALVDLLWYLPVAVGFVLFPRTAARRDGDAAAEVATLMRWTMLGTAFAALGLLVLIEPVISVLFGDEYLPAVDATRLILPGALANTWFLVLGSYLMARGRLARVAYVTGAGVVVNIGLNLLLIPRLGIEGAALASTVSYTLTGVVVLRMFMTATQVPLRRLLLPTLGEARSLASRRRRAV
jgi:O-antigen/teichoic acid export membrane protein